MRRIHLATFSDVCKLCSKLRIQETLEAIAKDTLFFGECFCPHFSTSLAISPAIKQIIFDANGTVVKVTVFSENKIGLPLAPLFRRSQANARKRGRRSSNNHSHSMANA